MDEMQRIAEKLSAIVYRYDEIAEELSQPETMNDMAKFQRLTREHSELDEMIARAREYIKLLEDN